MNAETNRHGRAGLIRGVMVTGLLFALFGCGSGGGDPEKEGATGNTGDSVQDEPMVDSQNPSAVSAVLLALSRSDGVSPETIYFSAEASTCDDCDDVFGLGDQLAIAWSTLSYHFNFDDADSGVFAQTAHLRNEQVSGAPRAFHTFECSGINDPNWDNARQVCAFDVGVRVQASDGEYDDAFVEVAIQPLYGPGGYYNELDIWCVSSTADFAACPHNDPSRHLLDSPSSGEYSGRLFLFQNGSPGNYAAICVGADERNTTVATYDSGSRPIITEIRHSTRPGTCLTTYTDATIAAVAANQAPQRDSGGNLIDGYAFNASYTGLAVGSIINGPTYHLANFHNLGMDWEASGTFNGEIVVHSTAWNCINSVSLSCSNVPYSQFGFYTQIVSKSHPSNLAPVNIACYDGCGATNFVFAEMETNRSFGHNARFMGLWGGIFSNNWFRGNHVGGNGGKERLTVRPIEVTGAGGTQHDLNKNPEILDGVSNYRANQTIDDYYNRYNIAVDNIFNQPSHDANHDSSALLHLGGNFTGEYGNTFIADDSGETLTQTQFTGRYKIVREATWASGYRFCTLRQGFYLDGTLYNNAADNYVEAPASCSGGFPWPGNIPALSYGTAPIND